MTQINMVIIFHMSYLAAMYIYWELCKFSYFAGKYFGKLATFTFFEDNHNHSEQKISQKSN